MLELLNGWTGSVEVNGTIYDSGEAFSSSYKVDGTTIHIKLHPSASAVKKSAGTTPQVQDTDSNKQYRITVKPYMTKNATPEFDFMAKWNEDRPMPYRTMIGEKVKETRGMVYMNLHADIVEKQATLCMCCGKPLTNPVSQYFGIGPECGHHNYINPFDTEEELKEAVNAYREKLRSVTWEGWIIKSAIITEEVI